MMQALELLWLAKMNIKDEEIRPLTEGSTTLNPVRDSNLQLFSKFEELWGEILDLNPSVCDRVTLSVQRFMIRNLHSESCNVI